MTKTETKFVQKDNVAVAVETLRALASDDQTPPEIRYGAAMKLYTLGNPQGVPLRAIFGEGR